MKNVKRKSPKSSGSILRATARSKKISSATKKKIVIRKAGHTPVYEIYALKNCGPMPRKLARFAANAEWNEDWEITYYLWLIKGQGKAIVVDTGVGPTLAKKRDVTNYVDAVDVLAEMGVNGLNLTTVILTHFHFDHFGGMETFPHAFPKAKFYMQKKEFDFWTKHPFAKKPSFYEYGGNELATIKAVVDLKGTGRLVLVRGDQKIMPGIEVLLSPGHTIGLQTVAVNTEKGTAIIASDGLSMKRCFTEDSPPAFQTTDLIACHETYDKLRAKATSEALVFAGHEVTPAGDYPRVSANVTRLI